MFRNVHFDKWNNVIHLWETKDKKRIYKKIPWVPYVFVKSSRDKGIKSIFGDNVEKREFRKFSDYKDFCEANQNNNCIFENNVKPEIQFLCEHYADIPDDEIPQVDIRYLAFDIEVYTVKIDYKKNIKIKIDNNEGFFNYKEFITEYPSVKEVLYFNAVKKSWISETVEKAFSVTGGFPEPIKAEWPVSMITCYDSFNNKTYTLGLKEYKGKNLKEPWFEYLKFDSEKKLLKAFFTLVHKFQPDVITGWNSNGFDVPYIVNRTLRIFNDDDIPDGSISQIFSKESRYQASEEAKKLVKLLSPINIVTWWPKLVMGKEQTLVDIAGISLLDYRDIYKKYTKTLLKINLEKYSLEVVSQFEFEKGKLDYSEFKDLNELYEKDFDKYTDYNIIDVKRVKQIQEKRKFIQLIQTLSLLTKCPMKWYEAVTNLIEGVFLTYYRRNGLCAEKFTGGDKEQFDAAYVKQPYKGLHKDVIDLDITSSYPHAMITLNMGNETYKGIICNFLVSDVLTQATENTILEYIRKKEFVPFELLNENEEDIKYIGEKLEKFNEDLKNGKICISPNGVIFSTEKVGSIAAVEKYVFGKRKDYKKKMIEIGKIRDTFRNKEGKEKEYEFYDNEYDRFKSLQIAVKLIINAIYGAISVPFFRSYNLQIAKAICSVGRHAVKSGEKYANEIMNNPELSNELSNILHDLLKLKK